MVLAAVGQAKVRSLPAQNSDGLPIVKSHERNVRDHIFVKCDHPNVQSTLSGEIAPVVESSESCASQCLF